MKKKLLAFTAAAVLMAPQMVGAEGFAIYEWSAEGLAMGGARMFAEDDAANVAFNPASITKVKGEAAKISATYLSPHGKYDLQNSLLETSGHNRIHPAWAPGMYYVRQINDKEWLGMATYSRFGLISQFERNSAAGSNAFSSKLFGVSLGVNYAHKFDKKWTGALGAEVNYVGLQLDKNLLGVSPMHIEGESYALGWNAAANYTFDEKNEMGVVYRSKINHSMEADYDFHGHLAGGDIYGDAYGCVTLPESIDVGYSHKFNDKTRIEARYTWTRWDRYDALDMNFSKYPGFVPSAKNWSNGQRFAIGLEHKFSDKYSGMLGYAHDKSSIPYNGGDFMIPTGTRTTYSIGAQYHDKKQTLGVALAYMNVGCLDFAGGGTDLYTSAHSRDSYTKIASISYQRHF
ncbi:outer membrane protein transport protein [uncultured Phascolarctobacterium sp.]|uniref:OmpP1/FadL family transporter n=1 Tax=uncultured Phascolarctobacterium sp. TaxID=512296 RepID=UPI0026191429|nr:outer membrane protein transport protein [uncultured Phascolarctobacterium sp.]